ncbi:MAG: AAA family ATPase [Candidatus Lokiarchaeota archaeon]|nr:AAA family ATPase [Candidatus Lokiarchaeota archaeon]
MKMKSAYIVSYSPFSGKTSFSLGLGLVLKENGYKVGYFKPIGVGIETEQGKFIDPDVILMKDALNLDKSYDEICPPIKCKIGTYEFVKKYQEDRDYFRDNIVKAYNKLKDEYDFLIIEGRHRIQSLFTYRMDSINLSKLLDSKILLISNGVIDDIVLQKKLIEGMDAELLGVVFNNIDIPLEEKVKGELIPIMERYEIKFYGYVPEKPMLIAPSAKEYHQALGGQVLVGNKYLNKLVLSFHIGAMRTDSAMRILKRFRDYALITGGDRSDLISRALENSDIALLILTGNLYPEVRLLVKAEEQHVPVLLVPHETSVTYNICQNVRAGISPDQKQKIQLVKESIEENIQWKEIYEDA